MVKLRLEIQSKSVLILYKLEFWKRSFVSIDFNACQPETNDFDNWRSGLGEFPFQFLTANWKPSSHSRSCPSERGTRKSSVFPPVFLFQLTLIQFGFIAGLRETVRLRPERKEVSSWLSLLHRTRAFITYERFQNRGFTVLLKIAAEHTNDMSQKNIAKGLSVCVPKLTRGVAFKRSRKRKRCISEIYVFAWRSLKRALKSPGFESRTMKTLMVSFCTHKLSSTIFLYFILFTVGKTRRCEKYKN